MISLKDGGVSRSGVHPAVYFVLGVVDVVNWRMFALRPVVVTSMNDGQHRAGSLHYAGRAVDIRTHDLALPDAQSFARAVELMVSHLGFDVVLEDAPPHLHVEYDPKPDADPPRVFPLVESV